MTEEFYDNSGDPISQNYILEVHDKNGFYPFKVVSLNNIRTVICNDDTCPYYKKKYSCFGISGCILKLIQDRS